MVVDHPRTHCMNDVNARSALGPTDPEIVRIFLSGLAHRLGLCHRLGRDLTH